MDELCDFIGLRFVDAGTTELEIAPRHINPAGVLSGVVTYALVDYGMGRALWEVKEADETVVTVSLSLNYVGSVERGRDWAPLRSSAVQVHNPGRSNHESGHRL